MTRRGCWENEARALCRCYKTLQEVGHCRRGRDARVRDSSWRRLWRKDFQGDRVGVSAWVSVMAASLEIDGGQ